ncbi:sensor histidine kinase [Candidatus Pelagibacter sp. RS40]|uniref:sensor histidine kinase n=1 Tax=Candidatus Pelagibacter sp. RS40 TaxID=1977865 RepID=UPI000A157D21|nr:ATP-binding protein [Candidatus Pelagibacter sp. RS40]ARJ48479.1 two-component sensor histidine kinase [Candidatus Pelagibacter sp. RS40]
MFALLKRNLFIIIIFIFTLSLGFLTFLTFIGKSFINLNENNLQILLIFNFILLIIFFVLIFLDIKNSIKNNINVKGAIANKKYIISFGLFTLIPSLLISIFSLFIFSFALDKYFDTKITSAVNNSYEIAKNYVEEKRNKIESEIILIAFDLNKYSNLIDENPQRFQSLLNTQRVIRDIDQLHLINGNGDLIISAANSPYKKIEDRAIKMVLNDDRPLKIINTFENKSAAVIRLTNYNDTFLYVVKLIDKNISQYLIQSEEAVNFYYTVENQSLGIRISFALIYIALVTLLLFLSITIAIRFSSRFFISINNLISASEKIGKGNLDTKVPELKADKEMELLNKNFNLMIDRLKSQQEKLLTSERHEAWENVARKLAHEIKNPLTPIQLTVDNIKSKYLKNIELDNQDKFKNNLQTIQKQIQQIEKLVNEFSDFARMPKPLLKKNNLNRVINENINLINKIDSNIKIKLINHLSKDVNINFDLEQFNRLFFNLIKNSLESIQEKTEKDSKIDKNIDIEIRQRRDYIIVNVIDSGTGFKNKKTKELIKPYFTTKKKGTGLGLSIVDKIISDHNGSIQFLNHKNGAKVQIILPNK